MDTSQNALGVNATASRAENPHPGICGHSTSSTPRKQQQIHTEAGSDSRTQTQTQTQDVIRSGDRTATKLISGRATLTPTPQRYDLREPRASQGSFSTPSRRRRTASQQHLQRLSTPTKTSGSGAAAIRTGSPLSYSIGH
ncbi:uncharacterized protein TRIVIDRAFT_60741 [Trichoderma virens Gv29-8]|uniref:Uncharacterized protein n=1 Tax=Hypocrea virens (strain Gv29-8 / FGSC 10586) TaxID=413071 RepID=G9MTP7_HYPVG|nr:uncharacterized protein TRIVIDRAFT_60741 [Trichoderma virens Gv29-8]EHK22398.1 hypothetical protein TRIVIDRAFT_60741 [Trichoderma virens Gv29-8]UKZ47437.1 hypothetical protein TrVGV298_001655 [Trichoderma virens]